MNGNTRIKALNCTVRQEAISQVSAQMYKAQTVHDAILIATDGAQPGTIGGMVKQYIVEMEDETYSYFCSQIKRQWNKQRKGL